MKQAKSNRGGKSLVYSERPSRRKSTAVIQPRLRILRGDLIGLGPGKAALLRSVQVTGSISAAAENLGMSYMRAWKLIKTMNAFFHEPVIKAARGGQNRGGAELTETGKELLFLYERMEARTLKVIQRDWQALQKLIKT